MSKKTKRHFGELGKLVRYKRVNHPNTISQVQLSKKLGYENGQFVSNIERGLCGIPLYQVGKLAKELDMDIKDLIEAMQADLAADILDAVHE